VDDAEVALIDTAEGYALEIHIPWAALGGFQAFEHRQIGFDVGLNDDDTGGGRQTWLSWGAPVVPAAPPGDPATWGVALLGVEPSPTAVDLLSFTATSYAHATLVSWQTTSETDTLGFHLYRSDAPAAARVRLNQHLIPSQVPGSLTGATYTWRDGDAPSGAGHDYWLQEVRTGGTSTWYGPARRARHRILLPLVASRK
jgi:hypothetical protein